VNPEFLQTFGVLAIGLGFVLIGLGGISTYHASQQLQHQAELREVEKQGEMNAQILTLMMKNQELVQKVEQAVAPTASPAQEQGAPPTGYYRPPSPPPPVFSQIPPQAPEPGARESRTPEPPVPDADIEAPEVNVNPPHKPHVSDWDEPASIEPSWRYLTGRQWQVISETLRAHGKHTVTIESSYGDDVSRAFAEELGAAFAEADWVVRGIDPHRGLPLASGVTVSAASFPPQPETRAVYEALLSAGIAATQQLDPKQKQGETLILVGVPL